MGDWPKVEKFLSPDEIVDVLFERLKDARGVEDFVREGPGMYHHGLGTSIRNEFHLWHPENPYTMKDYVPELRDGADCNPRHADNTSGAILEALHARLKVYWADERKRRVDNAILDQRPEWE